MVNRDGCPGTEIFRNAKGYTGEASSLGSALDKHSMPTSLLMAMAAYDVMCSKRERDNRLKAGAKLVQFIKGIIDAANSNFMVHITLPCGSVRSESLEHGILTGLEHCFWSDWQTHPMMI